jgi:hypothetical protein
LKLWGEKKFQFLAPGKILELPNTSHYTIFRSATEKTTHPTLLTHSTQAKRLLTQKCGVFIKAMRSSSACLMVNLSVINQPADFSVQMDGIHRSLAKSGLPGSLRLLKLEKHVVYLSLSTPVQIEKLWMYPILWRWWSQGAPFFTLGGKICWHEKHPSQHKISTNSAQSQVEVETTNLDATEGMRSLFKLFLWSESSIIKDSSSVFIWTIVPVQKFWLSQIPHMHLTSYKWTIYLACSITQKRA